ncbi:hypothetical protein Pfo_000978 [Paulownia fortunei]|nr:hypothetical protein Pfo_000978 [Paulownia fortunei]
MGIAICLSGLDEAVLKNIDANKQLSTATSTSLGSNVSNRLQLSKNDQGEDSVSIVVLRESTDNILDDLERAVDGGVDTYRYAIAKFAESFAMITKTLVENAGLKAIEIISFLYAEHASGNTIVDIHLEGGVCRDVCTLLIWDPHITKFFALKNAADAACTVLRVDQVISCHLSVFAKSHHWQTSIHKFCPYYFKECYACYCQMFQILELC